MQLEVQRSSATPAELLKLGLGGSGPYDDEDTPDGLGEFLCACPELELQGCLGRGGMGIVYRARQVRLDRDVAVKLMSAQLSQQPEFAHRFEREAKALARLDHPGIVRVHDFGQAAGVYYLVMELVDGPNLRDLIDQGVGETQALAMMGQLCDALAFAHEQGVVHRDIKPENVLVDGRGRVRIADFGLAKLERETADGATRTRRVLGTPQYMAPEQLRDPGTVDQRCDIFAVGVVFYEMLTGQLPVGRFPAPSELGHGDPRLDEIVLRALESSRERRFQTVREISVALDTRAAPTATPQRWRARWWSVAAGLCAAGGLSWWLAQGGSVAPDDPAAVGAAVHVNEPAGDAGAGDAATEWAKRLNRWPAQELAVLDADVVGVAGIDWSELRQAPVVQRYRNAMLSGDLKTLERCDRELLEHTHKIVVSFSASGARELVVRGTWDAELLPTCIDRAIALLGKREARGYKQTRLGRHRRLVWPASKDEPALVVSIAQGPGTLVVSLRPDISAEQLDAKISGQGSSLVLRDRVLRELDLSAPIWILADPGPGVLPMGIHTLRGGIELWDKLGINAEVKFNNETAATSAKVLIESYANILATVPDLPTPPEFSVTREGDTVRVQATVGLPEFGAGEEEGAGTGTGTGSLSVGMGNRWQLWGRGK